MSGETVEKIATIKNKYGLHARPATQFVELASRYNCDVVLLRDGEEVNGKSIMGLMMLGAEMGTQLTVRCFGAEDAPECIDRLVALIDAKFGEE
ncbi:MAG TPA: HPr family phosphocarrier protein [Planctomycetota bacterium]|nr:HPr family phosphocarrier protein [Planctomycetota bacterium]